MKVRRIALMLSMTAALVAVVPAAASAKTVELRGVVSGSPYGASNGYMAVPVLYSKQTARNVGLKSPVGLLVFKRTGKVKLPNGGGYQVCDNLYDLNPSKFGQNNNVVTFAKNFGNGYSEVYNGFDIGRGGYEYALTQLLIAIAILAAGAGKFSLAPGKIRNW